MTAATRARHGPVVVDVQALQASASRGRGIGRYAADLVEALEQYHPDLVGRYLMNPDLPPPAPLEALYASGKLAWRTDPGAIDADARVLHLLSPLDCDVDIAALWPASAAHLRLSATVYDLIPAADPPTYLVDEVARRRYRTRLALLRGADHLQVLSGAVAADLSQILGVAPSRITCVGAAVGPRFRPPRDRARARELVLGEHRGAGLTARYVLCPSGTHPRKNNETLIEAFASVARGRDDGLQLVIAGEFPAATVAHFAHLASENEIAGRVVVPGFLDDEHYAELFTAAELVCVPSLAEGFGYPVAEAIACGTRVIASERPPLSDLVGPEARFDPRDPAAIAAAIARGLDPGADLGPPAVLADREAVARACAGALERLAGAPRIARRRRARRRLALVSPFPPAPSGVAAYSNELARALLELGSYEVVLFGDGPTPDQVGPGGASVCAPRSLIAREALEGRFDHVCYTLGNSHHHLEAMRLLRERSGVVLAHDVRLTNLYRHLHGDPGFALGGLGAEIAAMYRGGLPRGLGASGAVDERDVARFGVLMAREAISRARRFLVSSRAAAALARADAGAGEEGHIGVLPFAFFADGAGAPFRDEPRRAPGGIGALGDHWGAGPDARLASPVLCHFGIVDPAKEPEVLLAGVAALRRDGVGAQLVFVGPIADSLAEALAGEARALELEGAVSFTGPVSPGDYRAWLARADVALQLRRTFNGEASAALGDCLGAGVPTIVRNRGFFAEVPSDALVAIAPDADEYEIARAARALLDPARRARVSRRAREVAREHTFTNTARALCAMLEEGADLGVG